VKKALVRVGRPSDAGKIAALLRSGFEPRLRKLTPYGCPGAHRYVRSNVGRVAPWCDIVYTVAQTPSGIVGCGEFRRTAGGVFLNYIAVEPSLRGKGIGSHLLATSLRQLATVRGVGPTLALDVFAHNTRALEWYRHLGFEATGTFAWYEVGRPRARQRTRRPALSPELRVRDMAQAEATHLRLGFSEFTVEKQERRYTIGRLARGWYRLTDPEAALDQGVIEVLGALEPRRAAFLVARPAVPDAPWPIMLSGWRMEAPLVSVTERLQSVADDRRGEAL
jgi:ribosomal protein S18 acetylase RimI-like enzyme